MFVKEIEIVDTCVVSIMDPNNKYPLKIWIFLCLWLQYQYFFYIRIVYEEVKINTRPHS
jgi:hypothetical protein